MLKRGRTSSLIDRKKFSSVKQNSNRYSSLLAAGYFYSYLHASLFTILRVVYAIVRPSSKHLP